MGQVLVRGCFQGTKDVAGPVGSDEEEIYAAGSSSNGTETEEWYGEAR